MNTVIEVNGINIHYKLEGPENGPSVVFSNSLGTDLRIWDEVISYLPKNIRILRYDKRGHGLSDCPKPPYSMGTLVRDIEVLMDALELKNSLFIGLNGGFAPWVGSVLKNIEQKILLVCDNGQENEAITRLARVGFDNVVGYLSGGFHNWEKSGESKETIDSVTAQNLEKMINGDMSVVDVRTCGERKNGFLKNSVDMSLDKIESEYKSLDNTRKHYIHCAGGYRSMIACSYLKKQGLNSVVDVQGGFSAISKNTDLEIIKS